MTAKLLRSPRQGLLRSQWGELLRSPWALLAAVFALRSAGFVFGVLNIDESDYMLFGAGLLHGGVPYRDLVEIKPPLGYLTYAPAGLFGLSIQPMRVVGVLWVFATALLLKKTSEIWTSSSLSSMRSRDAGWAAAWLYLLATLCEVPSFGSELMMNLPTAAALYWFARAQREQVVRAQREQVVRAQREQAARGPKSDGAQETFLPRSDLFCGVCLGLASLYRHQGAIGGVALGLCLLWQAQKVPALHLRRFLALLLGSLAPWVAVVAAYAMLGQLPVLFEWVVTRNLAYAGPGGAGSALARGLQSTLLCLGATALPWVFATREAVRDREPTRVGLALLLVLTCAPVAIGGRFYEHYYLQFAPPLAVLGAPFAASLAARLSTLRPALRGALATALVVPLLVFFAFTYGRGLAGRYPEQEPRTRELARFIRQNSAPDERLFVWGHFTPIYTLSQRLPGTRYANTSVHMGNFDPEHLPRGFDAGTHKSQADVRATLDDLEARKPALFVDTAPADIHGWARIPLASFPEIATYLDQHYELVGSPGGAHVYRRIDDEAAARHAGRALE